MRGNDKHEMCSGGQSGARSRPDKRKLGPRSNHKNGEKTPILDYMLCFRVPYPFNPSTSSGTLSPLRIGTTRVFAPVFHSEDHGWPLAGVAVRSTQAAPNTIVDSVEKGRW